MTTLKDRIEDANTRTVDIIRQGKPQLVDVAPALDVLPGMLPNLILHSAPAIAWDDMCGPHKHGIIGAALWEGLASTPEEAEQKIREGEILTAPCHHHMALVREQALPLPPPPCWWWKTPLSATAPIAAFLKVAGCACSNGVRMMKRFFVT